MAKQPSAKSFSPKQKMPMPQYEEKITLRKIVELKLKVLDFISPLAQVALRIWLGLIFWKAGVSKLSSWDSTLWLFENEYKTHEKLGFGNPEFFATLGATSEILFSILLIMGLFGRGSAFVILCMAILIDQTYVTLAEHKSWMVVALALILQGAGKFSLDYFIRSRYIGGGFENNTGAEKFIILLGAMATSIYAIFLIFSDIVSK